MITTFFSGRLGNLLFEIAAAESLAIDNNTDCKFDLRFGDSFSTRHPKDYKDNILNKIKLFDITKFENDIFCYREPSFNFNTINYNLNKEIFLIKGYFQSEKYFINNKNHIINLFTNNDILNNLKFKFNNILTNSVSIHIRRGDYLNHPNVYYIMDFEYIKNCLNYIESNKKIDNILIFSDDIYWCKQNIQDDRIKFIENQLDYEDLYLMSLCENNICSNSTFSWWASYLNKNTNKIVIFPKNWFKLTAGINSNDIYYQNSIIL